MDEQRSTCCKSQVSTLGTCPVLRFSPICPLPGPRTEGTVGGSEAGPCDPVWATHDLVLKPPTTAAWDPMGASSAVGLAVPGTRCSGSYSSPGAQARGMAPEGTELLAMGLSPSVVGTLQEA